MKNFLTHLSPSMYYDKRFYVDGGEGNEPVRHDRGPVPRVRAHDVGRTGDKSCASHLLTFLGACAL